MFGSVLAASLPIIIAVFAVGTAIGLVRLPRTWLRLPTSPRR